MKKQRLFIYRPAPNRSQIKGLDLSIDPSTQKLCETYNQSSSDTRSILYVLLIVSCLSLAAVFNSNSKFSWSDDRITFYKNQLYTDVQMVKYDQDLIKNFRNKHQLDSEKKYQILRVQDSIDRTTTQARLDGLVKGDIDNTLIVKIPIIGVQIDINDLASISGFAIVLLLYLLQFTILREKSNIRIALNAINERYPAFADPNKFEESIKGIPVAEKVKTLEDFNFVRRRFHYNFLSMNEVFNIPHLDSSRNLIQRTRTGKIINTRLFYIFFVVYAYILFNDFCSYDTGLALSPQHTLVIIIFSLFFFFVIFSLCESCVRQKVYVYRLFHRFWYNNYQIDENRSYEIRPMKLYKKIGIPVTALLVMLLVSIAFRAIPEKNTSYNGVKKTIENVFFIKSRS